MINTNLGQVQKQSNITFIVETETHKISFRAYITHDGGLYFMPYMVTSKSNNRTYRAYTYLRKHIPTIREVAHELKLKKQLLKMG